MSSAEFSRHRGDAMNTVIQFRPEKQKGFVYVSEAKENRFFFVVYAPAQTRKAYVVGRYGSDRQAAFVAQDFVQFHGAIYRPERLDVVDSRIEVETQITLDTLVEDLEETLGFGGIGWRINEPAGYGWTLARRLRSNHSTEWVRYRLQLGARRHE
jgi:hypothetical protein